MAKKRSENKQILKILQAVLVVIISTLVVGVANYFSDKTKEKDPEISNTSKTKIKVFVKGAVEKSGVYELAITDRIIDAVEMAGKTDNSDIEKLNLAAFLVDGETINVPVKSGETAEQENGEKETVKPKTPAKNEEEPVYGGKININTATTQQLKTLDGIGDAIAQRIIDYRNKNGKFENVYDILAVSGIGEKRFENICDDICVE